MISAALRSAVQRAASLRNALQDKGITKLPQPLLATQRSAPQRPATLRSAPQDKDLHMAAPARTIGSLSIESQIVIDMLAKLRPGDVLPYQEISAAIGRDAQHEGRGAITSARRVLLRDVMRFEIVAKVGVRRMTDEEVARSGPYSMRRIGRAARREAKKLTAIGDFDALPNDAKVAQNATLSMLGVVAHMTQPKQVKRIEGTISTASDARALPVGRVLEVFGGK